ncbi:V-set and transmembrane domain-containing protein 1 [Acomys russatus]|uniref:V-set and transmembrane domain-containing protein 1 n=1 Tax=Acomys russatus TaxID=60746 RepID=UPI0021E29DBA|nr:V-set and transmembrane domain-containing protein 1 [Acomys russatus]
MDLDFIYLLCLGLCLCYGDEEDGEELPRPSISAWPSPVVKRKSNVTLRCWTHFQNVTVTLGKLHSSEYQQERRSVGKEAEFCLTNLQPEDAGRYFCAYRPAASLKWSGQSQHLQLVVTG